MTRFGHDPTQNLGHDRDPVMTHNTTASYSHVSCHIGKKVDI